MEHKTEDLDAESTTSKLRRLVRQQSSKIGTLADAVVLPRNVRSSRIRPMSISAYPPAKSKTGMEVEYFNVFPKYEGLSRRTSWQISTAEQSGIQTCRISLQISKNENLGQQTVEIPQSSKPVSTIDEDQANKKVEHFPIFMIGISIVQMILFYSCDENEMIMLFAYDPHRRHEIWRLFTPILVHSGYSHLFGKLVMQLILGVFLEIVHEWKRISIIYLVSVFGGLLCINIFANNVYAVGASAGVMGLLFSHVSTIILNWSEMDRKFTRFFCVSLYIIYSIGIDIYKEFFSEDKTEITHADHFGGAATGFLISILELKNFKKRPWEVIMQKICAGILIVSVVIVSVINVTVPSYFPPIEWNFDYQKNYYMACDTDESAC